MRDKWVDNNDYFGPDRRRRSAGKRWGDRRHEDIAGQHPPLGALLRRLRVQMLGLGTPDDRRRTLQLLTAAVNEAERQQFFRCADALKRAEQTLRNSGGRDTGGADTHLVDAITFAASHE